MSAFESVHWPSRLSLATLPTPLHPLKRISTSLGGPNIWVKRDDLTGSVLSGNKVRKLEFTLAHAISKGHDLIITCGGLQSNHCRATSFACAQLNIPVHLILRGKSNEIDGNFLLDQLAGASIDCYSKQEYQLNLESILSNKVEHYRQRGYKPYVIPTGASDGVGVWGYFAAAYELKNDFEKHSIQPEYIVCASGSGGTQAGLTFGADFFDVSSQVIGMAVCDDKDYFLNKVDKDIEEFLSEFGQHFSQPLNKSQQINVNADYIGDGYGIASNQLLETIKWLAQEEGILLDPVYSGKAFHGLVNEIQKGTFKNVKDIVFVHTGGIFGVFPYKDQFQKQLI